MICAGINKDIIGLNQWIDCTLEADLGFFNFMEEEIWKDIEGHEGCYQVSSHGNIKSLDRFIYSNNQYSDTKIFKKGLVRKPLLSKLGYYRIQIRKSGVSGNIFAVHRIVAQAFIPNPDNKPQVNHKNGIKTDNRVENLEWNTPKENITHAFTTGLIKRKKGEESYNFGKIHESRRKIVLDTNTGIYYSGLHEASKAYNIKHFNLSNRLIGKVKNDTSLKYV